MKEELASVEVDFEELEVMDFGDTVTETRQAPGGLVSDQRYGWGFALT